jgi:orotate phosphoribosyltransferase-like protein
MPADKVKYNPFCHTSVEYGYQNPEIARRFAKFVVKVLKEKSIDISDLTIVGIDASSVFLAAFVKMLLPELEFISCSKHSNRLVYTNKKYLLFIDDYYASGSATKTLIGRIQEPKPNITIILMYIASSINEDTIKERVKGLYSGEVECFV